MEKDTLHQKLDMAITGFPVGCKVCNHRVGSVGLVCGEPVLDLSSQRIFIPVMIDDRKFYEDADQLFVIKTVKKGVSRHS